MNVQIVVSVIALSLTYTTAVSAEEKIILPRVVSYSKLTALDEKTTVQILTVELAISEEQDKYLRQVVGHSPQEVFKQSPVTLKAGKTSIYSGLRIILGGRFYPIAMTDEQDVPRYAVTFVVPGSIDLTGETLEFFSGTLRSFNSLPPEPDAKLKLTKKSLADVAVPFRAFVYGSGQFSESFQKNYDCAYYGSVAFNCYPRMEGCRFGKLESTRLLGRVNNDNGVAIGANDPHCVCFGFNKLPNNKDKLAVKFLHVDAWFACVEWKLTDTPAPPKSLK